MKILLIKSLYTVFFVMLSLHLWINNPYGDNVTKGILTNINVCKEKNDTGDTLEVFYLILESSSGCFKEIRCPNYKHWPIDSFLVYKNQILIVTWNNEKYKSSACGRNSRNEKVHLESYTMRIQDSNANDIPAYMPYYDKPSYLEYNYSTFVFYLSGLVLFLYLHRHWIVKNLFMLIFITIGFLFWYYSSITKI